MKNSKKIWVAAVGLSVLLSGCAKMPQIIGENTAHKSPTTMGIDRQDFEKAASDMVQTLFQSGVLSSKGRKGVVMISDVINDTTQRIDTKMITKKIRIAILRSGQAYVTAAQGTERDDTTIKATRATRGNKEFNQKTAIKEGQMINADFGLAGYILQRSTKTADGDQLVDYYFQMQLTDAVTGLAMWEDEVLVSKLGSNETVTW